jgi:asparagine synthase (glutamine-hydrolysing)
LSSLAGICHFDGQPIARRMLEAMTQSLAHRGPDGEGVWIDGLVGLGHRMLWTTPESLHENLPLISNNGGLAVTADARIDNRNELCRSLGLAERPTLSDSALILAAYEKWGECSPSKLVGDFAFAIWNKRTRTLFAARDRIGIKPFYYLANARTIAFASEILPLFQGIQAEKRPDREAIQEYLATSDLLHERTLFEGVRRLPPASTLTVRDGRIDIRKYWEPASGHVALKPDLGAHAEEFRELLTSAVKAQMRSAYPIGCLLSGGLDSSSILCLASRAILDKRSLFAFSMVFDRLPCDERRYIKEAVQLTGAEWIPHVVDKEELDGCKVLEDCFARQPEWPVQDLPVSATLWPLAAAANERRIRVMLTGLGGDQVAQGSPLYLADLLSSFRLAALFRELKHYRFSPKVIRPWLLSPLIPEKLRRLWWRLKHFAGRRDEPLCLSKDMQEEWRNPYRLPKNRFKGLAAWQQACWIADPLLSLYLDAWWDPLGSHSQIEFRHPFFDARLIEFLLLLPAEEKFWRGTTKILLRKSMKGVLPELLRERRSKAEFSPIARLAVQSIKINPSDLVLARQGFVESACVEALAARYSAGHAPQWLATLWHIIQTEAWYNTQFPESLAEMTHAG